MKNNSEHNKCVNNNCYFIFSIIYSFIWQLLISIKSGIKNESVFEKGDECLSYDDECPWYDDECLNSMKTSVIIAWNYLKAKSLNICIDYIKCESEVMLLILLSDTLISTFMQRRLAELLWKMK